MESPSTTTERTTELLAWLDETVRRSESHTDDLTLSKIEDFKRCGLEARAKWVTLSPRNGIEQRVRVFEVRSLGDTGAFVWPFVSEHDTYAFMEGWKCAMRSLRSDRLTFEVKLHGQSPNGCP